MSIQSIVDELKFLSMDNSKRYYEGSINGCFALGWFAQDMVSSLDEMGLTESQIQVLQSKVDRMHRILEETNATH